MNSLEGKITAVESSGTMSLISVQVKKDVFSAVVLGTPPTSTQLKVGEKVKLLFKETEVSLAKNLSGLISLRNRMKARIKKIERAKLLSQVVLDYENQDVVSIITTGSVDRLSLKVGDEVEWLVKSNEMTLLYGLE